MKKISLKTLPLYGQIFIGLALGIVFGLIAVQFGWIESTSMWIKPWGTIFINMLKLLAAPLILISLIAGVSNLKDISRLSRIGFKTFALYIITTMTAVITGLILVNIVSPGKVFPEEKRMIFQEKYQQSLAQKAEAAQNYKESSPLQFLVDVVPDNVFSAMTDNSRMLQLIFFAIVFGVAIVLLPENKTKRIRDIFTELNDIILKFVDIVMMAAPYGVFALIASLIVDVAGNNPRDSLGLFAALGLYAITVILGLFILLLIFYPVLIKLFSEIKLSEYFKGILPAQLVAFSTSSSAATLPVTMECAEKNLKIPNEISSFVLPVGATVNMDGTSLYQAVATVFIAQAFGMDLTFGQQLTIVLTATLASIGSAAVPGAGMVMLVIVLNSVHVPVEGIALIFAIDRPLDMFRTSVNVTSDLTVASIISKIENKRVQKDQKSTSRPI